jgi:hypothetical protein
MTISPSPLTMFSNSWLSGTPAAVKVTCKPHQRRFLRHGILRTQAHASPPTQTVSHPLLALRGGQPMAIRLSFSAIEALSCAHGLNANDRA